MSKLCCKSIKEPNKSDSRYLNPISVFAFCLEIESLSDTCDVRITQGWQFPDQ